jgi:endoglucanase
VTIGRERRAGRWATLVGAAALALACAGCGLLGGSGSSGGGARPHAGATSSQGSPTRLGAVGPACPAGNAGGATGTTTISSAGPRPAAPLLVDPASQPAGQLRSLLSHGAVDQAGAVATIADEPLAFPLGVWLPDVRAAVAQRMAVARSHGSTAVFMVYAIPHLDAGAGFSSGGAANADAYRGFTAQVAAGIGAGHAIVILEPDALAQIDSLPGDAQHERYELLNEAVDAYGRLGGTSVYLDGANCGWTPATVIADRLRQAGVARARGFAVNVSNFYPTANEIARGDIISALTGGAHFVVDTSRNGRGPAGGDLANPWCNPPGRGLGHTPTTDTGDPRADAFLWVKTPGASDGECGRGNPPAGTWWPAQAAELVRNRGS